MLYAPVKRPASQGPGVTESEFSAYNVVAEFPDLESAQAAIDALSRTIEADNITLTGPAADEAAGQTDTRAADTPLARYLNSRAGSGTVAGGLGGAIAGLLLGGFAAGFLGADVSAGMLLAVMLFGVIGFGALGGFVAGMSSLQTAEPWAPTFYDARGQALVGVHSENPEDIDLATNILEQQNPLRLYRVRPDGTPV
ncbi:MAG TPA: hypothetical protein VJL07_01730 [Dehalococcoidia bacterium]|nr:hypothetical protein [Dehalococcoidia bacterium]